MPTLPHIWSHVSLRRAFAMLIALVMALAPFAMQSAMAAAPSAHHAQSMDMAPCAGQSDDGQPAKSIDRSCCPAMCSTMALAPVVAGDFAIGERTPDQPETEQFGRSYVAKLATPPPRRA